MLMDEPFGALDPITRGTLQREFLRLQRDLGKTVVFVTHDVDEAILLADQILLMTNGPHARVAESVRVSIQRPRDRTTIVHDPGYYPIRNHLVDFLVSRSRELAGRAQDAASGGTAIPPSGPPLEVDPALEAGVGSTSQRTTLRAANGF